MNVSHSLTRTVQYCDPELLSRNGDNNRASFSTRFTTSLKNINNNTLSFIKPAGIFTLALGAAIGFAVLSKYLISSSIRGISNPAPMTGIEQLKLEREYRNYGCNYGMLGGITSGFSFGVGLAFCKKAVAPYQIISLSTIAGLCLGAVIGYTYSFYVQTSLDEMVN